MSEAWLGALIGGACLLISAGAAAWINLRKNRADIDKSARGGVIEEWREIVNKLQDAQAACERRTDALSQELSAMREQVSKLYGELSALRVQIMARETERVEQRGEINDLTKSVAAVKKSNPEEIATALAPKIADALTVKAEEVVEKTKEAAAIGLEDIKALKIEIAKAPDAIAGKVVEAIKEEKTPTKGA